MSSRETEGKFFVCTKCNKHLPADHYSIIEWDVEVVDFYASNGSPEPAKQLKKNLAEMRGEPEPVFHKRLFHDAKHQIGQRNTLPYLCGPLEMPNDMDEFMEWLDTCVHPKKKKYTDTY